MKIQTKTIIVAIVIAALLASCGFWVYMSTEVSLDTVLPQEQWHYVSIIAVVFEDGQVMHKRYTGVENVSGQIKQTLNAAQAERSRSFDDIEGNLLWIVISTGDNYDMWNLYLGENGLLHIVSLDGRDYYFENCWELYLQLQSVVEELPVAE